MGKSYLSEQPMALVANIFVLFIQTIPIQILGYNDLKSNGLFLLLSGLVALPLLYDAYKKVKLNNYLVDNGEIIEAKLHQDETKIIPLPGRGQGADLLRIQCSFFADGVVHIFKDEITFSRRDRKKISDRVKETDTVLVCTDNSCKTYKILFHSLLHELYDDRQVECPRVLNYIILFINIGIVVVSLFNSF